MTKNKEKLIIGIGQELRSDDAIGRHIAKALAQLPLPSGFRITETLGDGTDLMSLWGEASHIWLIDAVSSGREAGTIHHIDALQETIPAALFQASTHHWGVAEAIEMSKLLQTLPPFVHIVGIEGQNFHYGELLTPAVERAKDDVIAWFQKNVFSQSF
jgi:hydrogenase maturation protease